MSYAQNTENQEEVKYESKSWIGYENRKENERNRLQKNTTMHYDTGSMS